MFNRVFDLTPPNTVDRWNPAPPGMYESPCEQWDKPPNSTGARRISEPSTVGPIMKHVSNEKTLVGWVI